MTVGWSTVCYLSAMALSVIALSHLLTARLVLAGFDYRAAAAAGAVALLLLSLISVIVIGFIASRVMVEDPS